MTAREIFDRIEKDGITYNRFLELMEQKLNDAEFSKDDKFDYTKLNFQRSQRISKTYSVNEEIKNIIGENKVRQTWLVITEDWCGDSAQNLPYIVKIAELNPFINLKILLRDQNLDVMDLYLTNGKSRSIPKLVAFDENGNELFQWGPRPKEAQAVVDKAKNDGGDKNAYIEKLHLWYSENKGRSLEKEFLTIFQNS